ncbi:RNA degradosome polyphosphate kinase [Novosphingobium sp. Gsoil 351]|uniref:RNA degradosome polyphosphate kinase n=1 Tax=Novosphingobium sp. Gsoil 351 TaxID=2675225 RepID=UPI0012B5017D|nr:RNA degradosome polyphosphate kinase [Novosphingobium sp. Gsoil 351]QGN55943.1 RNA degradosome polyphosphate kinase [Novosphingobium sp. Gsoil 351]
MLTERATAAVADEAPALAGEEPRFLNRELSWLHFNRRVLAEAANTSYPLLERLRFLSISGTNLDEFFMVRVAGLRGQQLRKIEDRSIDGLTPSQQLPLITAKADALMADQQALWRELHAALGEHAIRVLELYEITRDEGSELERFFAEQLLPIITPQALDPAHPFPFIPNLGMSILFELKRKADGEAVRELIMLPAALPRFYQFDEARPRFVALETVLRYFSEALFPGFEVVGSAAFRVVRDSDIEIEEEAEDLVRYFRSAIKRRRRGRVIRLEAESAIPPELASLIARELGGDDAMISETDGLLGIADLAQIVDIDLPELKFEPYTPRFPERVREHDGDCFAAIREKDIVVHHPYESFDVVLAFLRQAAGDPDVLAIKQTLYRAGKQGAVIRALCDAAEAGKSVTAVVELKARFEEEQNLHWAAQLERSGVQVVYGFIELKTHAKISLVVRREGKAIRSYCHFGTGNYHPVTARIYTDLSFFTADPQLAAEAAEVFNYITGYIEPQRLEQLAIGPLNLREKLYALIDREIANASAGKPSGIWAKMNALSNRGVIDKLYEASAAGVPIRLIVRGVCCLRPGVPGLSDTIEVKSIIGRFLEHSRVWAFANCAAMPGARTEVYISSADWMSRNLDRRVEYALPLRNPTVHDQVLEQVMLANLLDDEQSWEMLPDGTYRKVVPGKRPFNLHTYFMTNPSLSGRGESLGEGGAVPKLTLHRRG